MSDTEQPDTKQNAEKQQENVEFRYKGKSYTIYNLPEDYDRAFFQVKGNPLYIPIIENQIGYPFAGDLSALDTLKDRQTDFSFSWTFDPAFVDAVCVRGIFPMAIDLGLPVMAPKLHRQRCIMRLEDQHIRKKWRKRAKNFTISINKDFDSVVKLCVEKHGENWLFPQLVAAFKHILRYPHLYTTKIYSVEVWTMDGELAGGELGFSVGGSYTSLSGATAVSNAGSIQLAVLGRLLKQCGFSVWDFGMEMDYKKDMGAKVVLRAEWLALQQKHAKDDVVLATKTENCREILDAK